MNPFDEESPFYWPLIIILCTIAVVLVVTVSFYVLPIVGLIYAAWLIYRAVLANSEKRRLAYETARVELGERQLIVDAVKLSKTGIAPTIEDFSQNVFSKFVDLCEGYDALPCLDAASPFDWMVSRLYADEGIYPHNITAASNSQYDIAIWKDQLSAYNIKTQNPAIPGIMEDALLYAGTNYAQSLPRFAHVSRERFTEEANSEDEEDGATIPVVDAMQDVSAAIQSIYSAFFVRPVLTIIFSQSYALLSQKISNK